MCRIAYFPVPAEEVMSYNELEELLKILVLSQGGDGNGVALVHDQEIRTVKGLDLTPEDAAYLIYRHDGPALFHTRLASYGPVIDQLCQPFTDGKVAYAHNGSWVLWRQTAIQMIANGLLKAKHPINDSYTIYNMIRIAGLHAPSALQSGVHVSISTTDAIAYVHSGEFGWEHGFYHSEAINQFEPGSIAQLHPDGPEFLSNLTEWWEEEEDVWN